MSEYFARVLSPNRFHEAFLVSAICFVIFVIIGCLPDIIKYKYVDKEKIFVIILLSVAVFVFGMLTGN